MNIGILIISNAIEDTQSVVNVAADHIKMLLDGGYEVKLIVNENCDKSKLFGPFLDNRLEWRYIENTIEGRKIIWHTYKAGSTLNETFNAEVEFFSNQYLRKLSDIDVCILHDIFYQGRLLVHNVALRKAQDKLKHIRFISFTHSVPYGRNEETKWPFSAYNSTMPNTTYVALSKSGIPSIAQLYGVEESKIRVVNHCFDFLEFLGPEVRDISLKFDFLTADIIVVYPARLMHSKRFEDVAAFAGAVKKNGVPKVKVIFCDAPSHEIFHKKDRDFYKRFITNVGIDFGLNHEDILYTSDIGYEKGISRSAVLDLFSLSNLFIFPSITEAYGLILLEAASKGNFLVLNSNVPVFQEFSRKLNAYLVRWDEAYCSYTTAVRSNIRAHTYLETQARVVLDKMRKESVICAKGLIRRRNSHEWIWEKQMKPLIEINVLREDKQ